MPETAYKCLLVDDDDQMLEILSRAMEMLNFSSITARDGDEGMTAFREHHPSLVISDIHMPNRNGLLLLNDIKQEDPEVPVILITGWLHYKAAMNLEGFHPDAFIEKPFTLDDLRKQVEELLPKVRKAAGIK